MRSVVCGHPALGLEPGGCGPEEQADTHPSHPPTQYLVSIPLRTFRLWTFTAMMAQVSTPWPHLHSYLYLGQPALWSP